MWDVLNEFQWIDALQILIIAVLIYYIYIGFRDTRGALMLAGMITVLLVLTFLTRLLKLDVIGSLLSQFSLILPVVLVVLFQPELRRTLVLLGNQRFFMNQKEQHHEIEVLIEALMKLSHKRYGALLALHKARDLRSIVETGVQLDAKLTSELILSIFHPKSALHDGGVIIHENRIEAASCVFPVSQREMADRSLGLRHRAGLGISEDTDVLVIVVSEETGTISIAKEGKLIRDLDDTSLRTHLKQFFNHHPEEDVTP